MSLPTSAAAIPVEITHVEADGRGAFEVQYQDVVIAEMTYRRLGEGAVVIDHTFVDDLLRGRGVARRLLDEAVAWARATGTKVVPTCPYALAQFDKDGSIRDVLRG